ncbi:MAG: type III pantothenate kinase [Bacteroidetes bacterium]|nr:type III pantothenate kinase [Bacteroidota bacterium]
MNLIIDIGNTRFKAALFEHKTLVEAHSYTSKADFMAALPTLLARAKQAAICTVVDTIQDIQSLINIPCLLFKSDTPIPVQNNYQTLSTLGSDRITAAVGAHALFPGKHCLVIDAGTCIKYNLITAEGVYLGGAISPGMPMRLKAMNHYTDRLPLIDMDPGFDTLLGQSTRDSLLSGALLGAVAEADGMTERYSKQYPGLITVITGGDGPYLAKRLKNHIFAEPYLVLKGLNEILIYNFEHKHL